jgi:myo-inositol-1(or 4)-monophosphatase
MFAAGRQLGATLNGGSLAGMPCTTLESAIVHIGLAIGGSARARRVFETLVPQLLDQRYFGSLALDIAWTAAGRFDACYYEYAAAPWDTAAGDVICQEAGLQVVHIETDGTKPAAFLAAPPTLLEPLLEALAN